MTEEKKSISKDVFENNNDKTENIPPSSTTESSSIPEKLKIETVQIEKSKLDAILKRLERVEATADKAGLARYDGLSQEKRKSIVKLLHLGDGRVVISWSDMIENIVEKDPKGYWFENQKVEVTFEDGEKETMPYVLFSRRYQKINATVISETHEGSETILKVSTVDDGKEYTINKKFVN